MEETRAKARRSDLTKASILAAARERFAADGYERATIRSIANQAAIDPAMVMRYFGSKERLFAEAAHFDLHLPDFASLPRGTLGAAMAANFVTVWESSDNFLALLRSAVTNEAAAARVREVFAKQVAPAILPVAGDQATALTRAALVSTQFLGLALCRYILKLPPVSAMTREEIVARVGPIVQRLIEGDAR